MKLDLFFELEPPPGPWASFPDGQRAAEQKVIREAIAQVQHADKFGFATAWFVEHHFRLSS